MKTMTQLLRNLMEDCIPVIKKGNGNCKVCLKTQCFQDASISALDLEDIQALTLTEIVK